MQHFPCNWKTGCPGWDIEIDMSAITEETFQVLEAARLAHIDSHQEVPEVTHIRRRINPRRVRGNGFYKVQLSSAEDGSQTLCGAQATVGDMSYGDTRYPSGRSYVSCEECKSLREAA